MPLIQVSILEGRPPEKIKALIENITNTVVETLVVPKTSVRVLVNEMPKTHWGVAGVPVSDRK